MLHNDSFRKYHRDCRHPNRMAYFTKLVTVASAFNNRIVNHEKFEVTGWVMNIMSQCSEYVVRGVQNINIQ